MATLLLSHEVHATHGADIVAHAQRLDHALELIVLPPDPAGRLPDETCARVELAFFSGDVFPTFSRQFFSTVRKAPRLAWLHVFNAGVDHPIYTEMMQRGVRLTTSSGSTAEPIAQTAITGMLMLGREFPRWLAAQARHQWDPARAPNLPRDLHDQKVLIVGLGSIGNEIARLVKALGMNVIGIRRSGRHAGDHADEVAPPERLDALLPVADWLVIACPLTPETRNLITAERLQRLPRGARVVNIARGEIVDEPALIAALQSGHVSGAYLDVFAQEPLPAESPLWDMPNVIVTPHNSAAAAGNDGRVYGIFIDNLGRWLRGEALANEVRSS
ncbi:MAG TPA: D-2-hydroxyacid dehydrogenase [Burkholderiales bacterium]|nr:D-2-hydroxyacid dehydrogenase [Burkholderiales bacterium]